MNKSKRCVCGKDISGYAELLAAAKRLIQHKKQGDLHPIDYQRLEAAIKTN